VEAENRGEIGLTHGQLEIKAVRTEEEEKQAEEYGSHDDGHL